MPSSQFGPIAKAWTFASSSNPSKKYETLQHEDGTITCNCPGWTKRAERSCKHTRAVEMGSATGQAEAFIDYTHPARKAAAQQQKAKAVEGQATVAGVTRKIRW